MSKGRILTVLVAAPVMVLLSGLALADEQLLCQRINAKQMPSDFTVPAMKFTGPAGDGRRGSAGFVVPTKSGSGTRLSFTFQRDASGYGFQIIHPLGAGHVLVSAHSRGVTLHRGGSWGAVGWGNPATSEKLKLNPAASEVLPLRADTPYQVVSELTSTGQYSLAINGTWICRHSVKSAKPLVLEVLANDSVWGGSGWDRTSFTGQGFEPQLQPGHTGLILGPMDGSGPKQHFQNVRLSFPAHKLATRTKTPASQDFEPMFRNIDNAIEFGTLIKSRAAGGGGGGAFESASSEPTLLVGFEYTLSRFYGGHLTVKSVRPIYQTRHGDKLGEWRRAPHGKVLRIRAKAGYVVTAIVAKHGHRLDGMRMLYMRVRNGRLNPDDAYRSTWIGGHGGGGETLYATYGRPIVSIFGRQGRDIDALGFVQVADTRR